MSEEAALLEIKILRAVRPGDLVIVRFTRPVQPEKIRQIADRLGEMGRECAGVKFMLFDESMGRCRSKRIAEGPRWELISR